MLKNILMLVVCKCGKNICKLYFSWACSLA